MLLFTSIYYLKEKELFDLYGMVLISEYNMQVIMKKKHFTLFDLLYLFKITFLKRLFFLIESI